MLESNSQPFDPQRAIQTLTLKELEKLMAEANTADEQERLIDELCKVVG